MSDKILVATEENGALALRRKEPLDIKSLNDAIQIAAKTVVTDSSAELLSETGETERVPYNFRTSGGTADIGDREEDTVIGGTIAWNQLIQNGNFADTSGWSVPTQDTLTVEGNKATISGSHTTYTRIQRSSYSKAYANHKYLIMLKVSSSAGKVTLIPTGSTSGGMFSFTGLTEETQIAKIWDPSEDYANVSWHVRFNVTTPDVSEQMTATVRDYCAFDLTQMFGSTIADYIYSLEQANAGDGVAWFKKLFPKEYYAYDAGSLQSVQTSAHKMVGFNAWDEEWESGTIQSANGQNAPDASRIRSKNYIPVVPNQPYYLKAPQYAIIYQYDSDKNFLGTTGSRGDNRISVFNSSTSYVRFAVGSSSNPVTTYGNDICLNLSWDGEKDGTYEPYVEYNYPLDSSLELRGMPKLDENNRLRYNGDTYESDGTVTRRYGIVDLGTLTWTMSSSLTSRFYSNTLADAYQGPVASLTEGMCSKYLPSTSAKIQSESPDDQTFAIRTSSTPVLFIYDTNYADAASLKAALSGVYFIYKLATPTTETAEPYTNPQIVNDFGTEEYVDAGVEAGTRDVAIPVGHETFYHEPLRQKIENLPKDFSTLIAETERGTTATRNYVAGEFLIVNNHLYKVTANIANGGTITPGTNVTATTIGEQLTAIFAALNN